MTGSPWVRPAADESWRDRAACRTLGTDHFYGHTPTPEAVAACASCPVVAGCLESAVVVEALDARGYRAGMTATERHELALRRGGRRTALVAECGTESGYARHRRHDERPCGPCSEANNAAARRRYARQMGATG